MVYRFIELFEEGFCQFFLQLLCCVALGLVPLCCMVNYCWTTQQGSTTRWIRDSVRHLEALCVHLLMPVCAQAGSSNMQACNAAKRP